jgi:uncharacterized protein (TIGR02452 family)
MGKRTHLIEMARETVAILQAGEYRSPDGRSVSIAEPLREAREGTRLYRTTDFPAGLPLPTSEAHDTRLVVTNESTLAAARRLAADDPCCLNFASAKHPGGGFLTGARAQEESLARSSGLYACIGPVQEMYQHNRWLSTCLYSDYMIYSPRVPVIRDDAGTLLEVPYRASFITSPAVNVGALRRDEISAVEGVMRQRTARVLWVARQHGHSTLVLGAWGCGVFRNDPAMIARLFAEQLGPGGRFHGVFGQVVFAVLDFSESQGTLGAFRARFPDVPRGC